jgi:glycosyltransferase involved in cell wall biosynthesis
MPLFICQIVNNIAFRARNIKIALKNLMILPKALYVSKVLRKEGVVHIHAHYGSTTSTMAYIISRVTGIPWSFTAHRWDIPENNLLKIKAESASFVRAIDRKGREEILNIVNEETLSEKIMTMHVGIRTVNSIKQASSSDIFTLLCPAMLLLKKGHKYLLEACNILSNKGLKFKCLIAGDGPLRDELSAKIINSGLDTWVDLLGPLSQENLFNLYSSGQVDLVVLPSIVTEDGEKEGIPVALMEAMTHSIPVISTNTGGIPELLDGGCGIMVNEKDPQSLAAAIEKMMTDNDLRKQLGEKGRSKIDSDFNVALIAKELRYLFANNPAVVPL